MRRLLTFAVAAFLASPAVAATWTHFFDCGDGDQLRHYSYEKSSVRKQGKLLIVPVHGDYSEVRGSRATEARMVLAIDCGARTYFQKRRTEHDAAGKVVSRYDTPTPPMPIGPPGMGQHLFDQVCADKEKVV